MKKALPLFLSVLFAITIVSIAKSSNLRDTTFKINSTLVTIYFPSLPSKGSILMLPGWNFSRTKTCENSSFCKKALAQGYTLICPEMGKSLYASAIFTQTRKDWAIYPQLKFIVDTLLPSCQNRFKLLKNGDSNFVYGISTGARGGALVMENTNGIFISGALLSGDYDQTITLNDNLINGYYGSYKDFKDRWEGVDNPYKNSDKLKTPLFIGHGKNDKIVAFIQSEKFANALKKKGLKINFICPQNSGHDFEFWESQTDAILKFFEDCK